jgi:hypothetical protein
MSDLTQVESEALNKLRPRVRDVLSEEVLNDDRALIRWLKARNYNVDKAEQMLRESVQWRVVLKADTILQTYKIPEVVEKYYAFNMTGTDREGSPVWLYRIGKIDFKGLLASISMTEMVNCAIIYFMEHCMQVMKEQSKKNGKNIDTYYVIIDCDGLSFRQLTHKPAIDFLRAVSEIVDVCYPETVKKMVVINSAGLFKLLFALVRPFMSQETTDKFKFFGTENWKEHLLEDIDPAMLPVHWGGTLTDNSGLPWCPELISEGGEVPKKYYRNNVDD